eukprot:TRINITY_DN7155_c3_g1_i1.p1 TRINITY_DN7155_c3_g1~~TRINITY_DN7155_c3_g1_i1.p1  ORF type:complete len:159 (-),score=4.18 TRINITY_DN7155_c3_g1_i1:48-524(-)
MTLLRGGDVDSIWGGGGGNRTGKKRIYLYTGRETAKRKKELTKPGSGACGMEKDGFFLSKKKRSFGLKGRSSPSPYKGDGKGGKKLAYKIRKKKGEKREVSLSLRNNNTCIDLGPSQKSSVFAALPHSPKCKKELLDRWLHIALCSVLCVSILMYITR